MKQSQIILGLLLPPRQDAAEAVHPTVGPFHHPAAGLETGLVFDRLGFFAAGPNVGGVTELQDQLTCLIVVVSLVQAEPLWTLPRGLGAWDRNAFKRRLHHLEIITVGTLNRQADGHARGFRQHATLHAVFGPIRGIGSGFFPRPRGPWSWPRPSTARTSRSLSTHRILSGPGPRASETPRRPSIPENADGRKNSNRGPWRSERSTDSRCARRRKSHSWPCDPRPADYGNPVDAVCPAAAKVRSSPTRHRVSATGLDPRSYAVRSGGSSWSRPSLISCETSVFAGVIGK